MTLLQEIQAARQRCANENAKLEVLLSSLEKHLGAPTFIDPAVLVIQETVAAHYGVGVETMRSGLRTAPIVKPRMIAMTLTHDLTGKTYLEIAPYFNRDRGTVLNAHRRVSERCQLEPIFAHEYETLKTSLQTRINKMHLQAVHA